MTWIDIIAISLQVAVSFQGASYALAAVGLNVHFGYTGLSNFGHVGFLLVGAYSMAIASEQGWSIWVGFALAIASSVTLGLALGLPTLRLRGDYLAIVTIASAEILRLVANARPSAGLTGGSTGIRGLGSLGFTGWNPIPAGRYGIGDLIVFNHRQLWFMAWGWGLVLLATLLVRGLIRSPWGRVLKSIREDEDAARAMGKNVVAFKLQAFVLGGVIGATAGVFMALDAGGVSPGRFIATLTFALYTVVILGGAGTIWGPVVGSVAYWFIIRFAEGVIDNLWFDVGDEASSAVRFALMGFGLMALVIFRPQGMLGNKKEMLAGVR